MCNSVSWLLLVKLSVLAKWLVIKTPLRMPIRDKEIVSRKPRPKSADDFFSLVYCFVVLLCVCLAPSLVHNIFRTPVAWYSLFLLKVLLNTSQPSCCCCCLFLQCFDTLVGWQRGHRPVKNSYTRFVFERPVYDLPCVGFRVVRIDPLRFLAECCTRQLNQV